MSELIAEAVRRTARKTYRCTCADEVVGWGVETTSPHGTGWSRASSQEEAERIAVEKVGQPSNINHKTGEAVAWYTDAKAVPRINRNYVSKSPDCAGDIKPGDEYIEYMGEAAAYQSGTRYCLPCGIATWGNA